MKIPKNAKVVSSISEVIDKISTMKLKPSTLEKIFETKRAGTIPKDWWDTMANLKLMLGEQEDGKDMVLTLSPLTEQAQIMWNTEAPNYIILCKNVTQEKLSSSTTAHGISPLLKIPVPNSHALEFDANDNDKVKTLHNRLEVFSFNIFSIIFEDVAQGNINAMDFMREWLGDDISEVMIKMLVTEKRVLWDKREQEELAKSVKKSGILDAEFSDLINSNIKGEA